MRDANVSSMPCAKEYCVNAKGVVGGRAADHAGDAAVLTRLLISNRPLATGCALHPHVPLPSPPQLRTNYDAPIQQGAFPAS
jgi:hypothetical protein